MQVSLNFPYEVILLGISCCIELVKRPEFAAIHPSSSLL